MKSGPEIFLDFFAGRARRQLGGKSKTLKAILGLMERGGMNGVG